MKTIKKCLFLAALTVGISTPIKAAHYTHYARKTAETASWLGACGLAWGIGFAPMHLKGIISLGEYEKSTELPGEKAPAMIAEFVHEVLQREELTDPKNIKIHIDPNPKFNAYACSCKHFRGIGIHEGYAKYLTRSLLNSDKLPIYSNAAGAEYIPSHEENIDLFRAILTHEATHIKHEHSKKRIVATITIPVLTFFGSLLTPVAKITCQSRTAIVATGCLLHAVNELLFKKYSRMQEQQADDAVCVPSEMTATLNYHKAFSARPPQGIFERFTRTYHALRSEHPSNEERAERYKSRLQE